MTFATPEREGFPTLPEVTEAAKKDRLGTRFVKAVYKGYAYGLTNYSEARLRRWFIDVVRHHKHPEHLSALLAGIEERGVVR